ncbi:MAG: hypothetical protein PHH24_02890 [Candidatus Moranbacteria bacterium]|jgi:hypothetical protein|nr:hypothetical protein [Candidatus Moranbacteria bacterium]MDD5651861.1 hypothetical protein [Candidatus Moranbacteria bacterium]MDX9855889.1 hypothetical protein [Candidatus Moranbacteria bacterium]
MEKMNFEQFFKELSDRDEFASLFWGVTPSEREEVKSFFWCAFDYFTYFGSLESGIVMNYIDSICFFIKKHQGKPFFGNIHIIKKAAYESGIPLLKKRSSNA